MKEPTCECPYKVRVEKWLETLYSEEEKSGMNHEPNKCKGTNNLKQYIRNGKRLWLCSCCCLFGDVEAVDSQSIKKEIEY